MSYHLGLGVISENKTLSIKGMAFSVEDTPFEVWDVVMVGYDISSGAVQYYASKVHCVARVPIFPI